MPTIHLTNFSSRALPRKFELGDGYVQELRPADADLAAVRIGEITMDTYRERFLLRLGGVDLSPGRVRWRRWVDDKSLPGEPVEHGSTLCCACSREKALKGHCHRVWAAHELYTQGWEVILDGAAYGPSTWPGRGL